MIKRSIDPLLKSRGFTEDRKYFEKWKTGANESKMFVWKNLQKR